MQQRRVRLGDIVDDYCPRERRVTNHAVVAMIDDTIKQTRCTTCDAEHEYKGAKVPAPRRRKAGALTTQDVETGGRLPQPVNAEDETVVEDSEAPLESADPTAADQEIVAAPAEPEQPADEADPPASDSDEWPVHRRLIRATLPRPEGQTPERKAPDFTFRPTGGRFDSNRNNGRQRGHRPMRQAQGKGGFGAGRQGSGQGGPQGPQRQGNRPPGQGGGRPGQGRGPRPGGSGRKRGR